MGILQARCSPDGSHLGAIGIATEIELSHAISQMLSVATPLGSSPDGRTGVYAHEDGPRARITVTVEDGRVVCMTPTFRPAAELWVQVASLGEAECPYERPLMVDVYVEGEMLGSRRLSQSEAQP